jgi:hypothetical protein
MNILEALPWRLAELFLLDQSCWQKYGLEAQSYPEQAQHSWLEKAGPIGTKGACD